MTYSLSVILRPAVAKINHSGPNRPQCPRGSASLVFTGLAGVINIRQPRAGLRGGGGAGCGRVVTERAEGGYGEFLT